MKQLFFLLMAAVATSTTYSQPGSLDKSFADTGVFVSQTFEGDCRDVLLQKDGRIISLSNGGYNNTGGFLLVRQHSDGSPDLSFGDSGRVVTVISEDGSRIDKGTLQEDGKILVAGIFTDFKNDVFNAVITVRYNPDGSIDSTFGINGKAIGNLPLGIGQYVSGIAVQPDGKIVMGGFTAPPQFVEEPITFFLLRYNTDGSPDVSFGNKGLYQEEVDDFVRNSAGFALQPDGKILLGATNNYATAAPFFVRRYTSDGTLDTEFGTNGEARFYFTEVGGGDMYAIALREDGRIVCGGNSALVQFNGDGSVDKTFGKDGFVSIYTQPYQIAIRDIALQPDGKVIAGGTWVLDKNNNTAFVLFRYEANGAVDSSFGDDGVALTQINIYPDADAVALQKDGKVILGGYSRTLNPNASYVTLVRYNGDESKRQIVVTRIKRWVQHHGISWQMDNSIRYYNVQRSNDGGVTYQPVAKIYNNHQTQYNYEDAAGKSNDLYRVAAVGKDGSRSYSNSVLISNESSVSVFPNPVRSTMQLQGLSTESKTNISIVDFIGNVRFSVTINGSTYSINTSNLQPGNYFITIETNKVITTQPFVKE